MLADLPFLPERTIKPREAGLTMVMDKGLSLREAEDLLSVADHLIDYIKLGFGTSLFTNNVEENQLVNSIKVFPNPATNQANICYQQLKEEGELLVYNMFGQMIFKEKLIKESSAMKFNIENYKAGLYKVIIKENSIIKGQASLIKQ